MPKNEHTLIAFGISLGVVLTVSLGLTNIVDGAMAAVGLLSNVALAVLTAALVWYTKALTAEAQATREAATAPNVVVTLEPSRQSVHLELVVENTGHGTAYAVSVLFNPKIEISRGGRIRVVEGLGLSTPWVIKPGQRHSNFIGPARDCLTKNSTAIVGFADQHGRRHEACYELDLEAFFGLTKIEDEIVSIARSLERISQSTDALMRGHAHVQVDVHDAADREATEAARSADWREGSDGEQADILDQLSTYRVRK